MANDVTREIMLCLAELSGKRYSEPHSGDEKQFVDVQP
jgi:hypothetical protein